jgi:hypothetical protein
MQRGKRSAGYLDIALIMAAVCAGGTCGAWWLFKPEYRLTIFAMEHGAVASQHIHVVPS